MRSVWRKPPSSTRKLCFIGLIVIPECVPVQQTKKSRMKAAFKVMSDFSARFSCEDRGHDPYAGVARVGVPR